MEGCVDLTSLCLMNLSVYVLLAVPEDSVTSVSLKDYDNRRFSVDIYAIESI